MIDTFLFDWGDTLMVDFADAQGKTCEWEKLQAVEGAEKTLSHLSTRVKIYIATGAEDSSERDIRKAFERVGLGKYISGYFCKANTGLSKESPVFYQKILSTLGKDASTVAMVGDNLKKDIVPSAEIGIQAFWLTSNKTNNLPKNAKVIRNLTELCV